MNHMNLKHPRYQKHTWSPELTHSKRNRTGSTWKQIKCLLCITCPGSIFFTYCSWKKTPANQLRLVVVYPTIHQGFLAPIPGGWEWDFWTIKVVWFQGSTHRCPTRSDTRGFGMPWWETWKPKTVEVKRWKKKRFSAATWALEVPGKESTESHLGIC